jgi:hypothetical protein
LASTGPEFKLPPTKKKKEKKHSIFKNEQKKKDLEASSKIFFDTK